MSFIVGIDVPFPLGARHLTIPQNYLQPIWAVPKKQEKVKDLPAQHYRMKRPLSRDFQVF
jgi:hypothetical protein